MKIMCLFSSISLRHFYMCPCISTKPFVSLFSSLSSSTESANPNTLIVNYLIKTFNFSRARALLVSNRYTRVRSPEELLSVHIFFRELGFSEFQIQSLVCAEPRLLFYHIENTLKPKVQYFQQLGLVGPDLGKLVSRNPSLFTRSLEKRLIPCIDIFKSILLEDNSNQDLIKVLRNFNWIYSGDWKSRILSNVACLESRGIVGSQLSMLLMRRPHIFTMKEAAVRNLVSQVLDMGLSVDSKMFNHGLSTLSCMNNETFQRKLELFQRFRFSNEDFNQMFRKAPTLLLSSEKRLKLGLEFFLNTANFDKKVFNSVSIAIEV